MHYYVRDVEIMMLGGDVDAARFLCISCSLFVLRPLVVLVIQLDR
jgi:hypothetical protein